MKKPLALALILLAAAAMGCASPPPAAPPPPGSDTPAVPDAASATRETPSTPSVISLEISYAYGKPCDVLRINIFNTGYTSVERTYGISGDPATRPPLKIDVKSLTMDLKKLDELWGMVRALDLTPFTPERQILGTDGYSVHLEFGSLIRRTALKVWMPTMDAKKRELAQFNAVCGYILDFATLPQKTYFK